MAADDAALTVTMRLVMAEYEAGLKAALRATETSAKQAEKILTNIGKTAQPGAAIRTGFQQSTGQMVGDARGLQTQLDGIFSGLATGRGINALQRGLEGMGKALTGPGLTQGASLLGELLMGMANPINLVALAFGVAASAAAEYFSQTDKTQEANDKLAGQAGELRKLAEAWAASVPGLTELADRAQRLAQMMELLKGAGAVTQDAIAGVRAEFDALIRSGDSYPVAAMGAMADMEKAGQNLITTMKNGGDATNQYKEFHQQLATVLSSVGVKGNEDLAAAIQKVANAYLAAAEAAGKLAAHQATVANAPQLPELPQQQFNVRFGQPYAKSWEELFPDLYRQQDQARKEAERAAKAAAAAAERAARERTREAERAAKEAADALNKAIANQTKTAVDVVTGMIGQSETTNRASINSFLKRGGVDLDAATTAWCAAFVNSALAQVGIRGTGSNVATSFMTWGRAVLPQNIQRGDVLVQARGLTAGEVGGHVGFATGNLRATAEGISQIEMISGNASDKVTTQWVNATGVIARRAKDAFQLPADSLKYLTEESKQASDAAKKLAEDQARAAQQFSQQISGIAQTAVSGLVNDLRNGVSAGEAFRNVLDRIVDGLLNMALQSLFSQNALGGLLTGFAQNMGSAGFPLAWSGGGTVGLSHPRDMGRQLSPLLWANAPRFAAGGVAGLRPGEIPAILHRGEIVIPRAVAQRGGSNPTVVHNHYGLDGPINIDMSATGLVAADNSSARQFGENMRKLIQVEMVRETRPGGLLRSVGR